MSLDKSGKDLREGEREGGIEGERRLGGREEGERERREGEGEREREEIGR